MKYYAFIDDKEQGPFELDELAKVGVRPSTYIWTKGMDDWQRADEVPEVCRLFRQHISDLMHPAPAPQIQMPQQPQQQSQQPQQEAGDEGLEDIPIQYRRMVKKSGTTPGPSNSLEPDINEPPRLSITLAVLAMIVCFLPTGIVAVVFTYKAQKKWQEAVGFNKDSEPLKRQAHEYARLAKMWLGLTVAFGLIFYGFLIFKA